MERGSRRGKSANLCSLRRPSAGAVRPGQNPASLAAAGRAERSGQHVAVRSGAAARGRVDRLSGRRLDAADPHATAGRAHGRRCPVGEGRGAEPDRHRSKRAGFRARFPCAWNWASGRWRFPRRATRPARWRRTRRRRASKPHIFMPRDVPQANYLECKAYGAHVTLVDGLISDCGRIVAERGPQGRLVRRQHAQGALPHRRQEDHGLRSGRADGLGTAGRHLLSHRRRRGHDRHVEGVRRDGEAGLDRRASGPR